MAFHEAFMRALPARAVTAYRCCLGATSLLLLAGCGGGDGGGQAAAPPPPPPETATVSVTVAGLRTGQIVTLANNGGDNLVINANGSFSFSRTINIGSAYAVTVSSQPSAETCTLSEATGTAQRGLAITARLSCGPTILHNFAGPEGRSDPNVTSSSPTVMLASDGNLYGTAQSGGSYGFGTIFRITPDGVLTVLHHFAGSDGKAPAAPLVQVPGGDLYGTTQQGGALGVGTLFRISREGTFTLLHSFGSMNSGSSPTSALIRDGDDFYGTTKSGGQFDRGTVFRFSIATGTQTLLHSFSVSDGTLPSAPLVQCSDGNFYGSTSQGVLGGGNVFRITPTGALSVLHEFGGAEGSYLFGPLICDSNGNIYGTTYSANPTQVGKTAGHIFKLTASGAYSVLHQFTGNDGAGPIGGLIWGRDGAIYGTTSAGGANGASAGTIFRVTLAGDFTSLHTFQGGAAGRMPTTPLVQTESGIFYGTTSAGGANNMGTIFKF